MTDEHNALAAQDIEGEDAPARKRGPGRPRKEASSSRIDQTRAERFARRMETWDGTQKRLHVDPDVAREHSDSKLRWINDDGVRMNRMTNIDVWQPVKDADRKVVKVQTGFNQDGSPMHSILCEKPQEWVEAERRKKQELLDEQSRILMRGQSSDPKGIQATGQAYVPKDSTGNPELFIGKGRRS
jgi:hypothetical protein